MGGKRRRRSRRRSGRRIGLCHGRRCVANERKEKGKEKEKEGGGGDPTLPPSRRSGRRATCPLIRWASLRKPRCPALRPTGRPTGRRSAC